MSVRAERLALLGWIALCFLAAGVGSVFTDPAIPTWYQTLKKPAWTPPSWLFGPVWTLLYLTMGVAAWGVWRKRGEARARSALLAFGVQLVLNAAWSALFFGLRNPALGLMDIALLWTAIVVTIALFWRVAPWTGALLIPYLAWVSFASALNYAVWRMNP